MRALAFRLVLWSVALSCLAPVVLAHDVTITGTQNFSALDGSSADHDGAANGVFTVSDGNLVVNGTVNCNDGIGFPISPCPMKFNVSGNMTVNAGGALYAEDRIAIGTAASITLTVGGNLTLAGKSGVTPGAIVSTAALLPSIAGGGAVTATAGAGITIGNGATIDTSSYQSSAGNISLTAGAPISIDGNVLSGPSRNFTGSTTGAILSGAVVLQSGGSINIKSTSFTEPALVVGTNAAIVAQGENPGAGPVTLQACGIEIKGLVAALGRDATTTKVSVLSGKSIVVDARDLGVAGATLGRVARLRADSTFLGTSANRSVELFARGSVSVLGPPAATSTRYSISSNASGVSPNTKGGTVRAIALEGSITASGRVADVGQDFVGGQGGLVDLASSGNADLTTANIRAIGNYSLPTPFRKGGTINVRSYSGNVTWINGVGDVRPVGSTSGLPPADQGVISLKACGTISTTGSSFPTNGVPTGTFPQTQTGLCAPAAPSLPAGVSLITCNTPPVANDTSATTNEDTTVTISLSGSDVDGDTLTFTIQSGPAHGSLGAIVPTGPTSATVDYTPALNYNGPDSFVFKVDDGNGGTDTATVTITVGACNDAPSFLAGPNQSSNEDSGPQSVFPWASAISPGPADESGQSVTFSVTGNSNPPLFSAAPSVAPNGALTYTAAANANGSATITVVAQDNGATGGCNNNTSAPQSFTITVNSVNDAPSFTPGGNVTVSEDSGAYSAAWASSISAGPANESGQTLSFNVSNGNNALFSVQPAISASGVLTFTPAADANGSAIVTVSLSDNGGTANGGVDTSPSVTFTITVNAVNDPPSFTSGGNVTVNEDSGAYSAAWASGISAGPADESGQTVAFNVSNDNNALFSVQPSISPSGVLTFTPATNAFGSANVTVTLTDNGGGSDTSAPQTFVITINAVNDAPSFTPGGNVTVNEDSGAYSAAWATGISAGPANESSQNLSFNASNDNNALFSVQPAISASGVLTFTPAADANGTATITVSLSDDGGTANGGVDTSSSLTFTITVNAVNDAPSFTSGGNVTVNEDSGAYSAAWATAISAGPSDESGQTVTFNVSNDNNALFSVQPSISPSGVLSFTVASNAFGAATVTVTLTDNGGGTDTSAPQTFTITVSAVNDAPSFTPGGNVSVNEDSGAYASPWASSISAGANESGQTLTFNVSNDNNALFSAQPSISPSGVLSFTPAPNANGSATVTVALSDDGGTANGGVDTSATVTFTITVNAVNDAPSYSGGGNVTVSEDSGAYSAVWATGISAGPADESGQTLTFNVTGNTNPALFSAQPSLSASGILTFTVSSDASGSSDITVVLQDNGGTANGGVDASAPVTFTIFVTAINDPPVNIVPGPQTTAEDTNLTFAGASAISVSDADAGASPIQVTLSAANGTWTLSTTAGLAFSVGDGTADATMTFTGTIGAINAALNGSFFSPSPNFYGSASVTITSNDLGNTGTGGPQSDSDTVPITVTAVNDGPTAANDAWETLGNTELRVDLGAGTTPHVADTTPSTRGVLDNDVDAGEGDPIVVSGIVGCADTVAPFDCVLPSGSRLSMQANGSFSFTPAPGLSGSDSFLYTATDIPSAGTPASANGMVQITLFDRIWYVNGSAAPGGDGTSSLPFDTFASLNGAGGAGDADSAGDYIFVHSSNVSGGIELEASQHLLGEGVGLTLNHNLNGNGAPVTLVAPGAQPNVTNGGGNAVSITSALPVEVRGLSLSGSADAIDLTAGGAYSGSPALLIASNTIRSAGADGIDINGTATGSPVVMIQSNVWNPAGMHAGNGIDVRTSAGSMSADIGGNSVVAGGTGIFIDGNGSLLTIIGFNGNSVNGNTGTTGVSVSNATFDQVPGGSFNTVAGGNTSVGAPGNGVPAGMIFTNVAGDLAFGTLDVYSDSGVALRATGSGAGFRLAAASGTASAIGGPAVDLTSVNSALQLASASSANSSTTGISLTNTTGTFSAPSGSITDATGTDFAVSAGSAAVTYGGTMTDDVGQLVNVSSAGGSVLFTGAISDGNDGDGSGVSLTSNTGTITFAGGLLLSTGANAAFTATGGGTVAVCDDNPCNPAATGALVNTLATTTANALNVTNTNISSNNLEFRSISANGATKGIVLNNTGTGAGAGGLKVTGSGATDGSGGTIQNISIRGAELIGTKGLSLKNMNFTNANTTDAAGCTDLATSACNAAVYMSGVSGAALDNVNITGTTAQQGINGLNVSDFALTNSTVTNCGTPGTTEEGCVKMRELTGTSTIGSSDLAFPSADVVEIVNTSGSLLLNVDSSTLRDSQSSPTGATGLQVRSQGTANIVMNVTNTSFLRIRTTGLNAQAINTASNDVDVSTSTFDPGTGTGIGLDLDADHTATLKFNVENNPKIYSRNGPAINVFADTSANVNGRINNNPDVQVKTNVGANTGSGIRANINKDAIARLEVKNNVVNIGSDDAGIDLSGLAKTTANPGGATRSLDATVTGNNVTIGATSTYGIILISAASAGNTNAVCGNVSLNSVTRNPSSIASFRARVASAAGFLLMQNFVTNAEATWNANGNTPASAGGSEVSFGGSGTFGTCTAALPTNPALN